MTTDTEVEPEVEATVETARAVDAAAEAPEADVRRWRTRLRVAAVGAGAAACVLGWALVAAHQASEDPTRTAAHERDRVLIAASDAVETLNALDATTVDDVDAGLDQWLAVTTGDLHGQLSDIGAAERRQLTDAGTVSTARTVQTAVTDLDVAAGEASVIAFVEVTVGSRDGEPTVTAHRFAADLERVDGTWLVAALLPTEVTS